MEWVAFKDEMPENNGASYFVTDCDEVSDVLNYHAAHKAQSWATHWTEVVAPQLPPKPLPKLLRGWSWNDNGQRDENGRASIVGPRGGLLVSDGVDVWWSAETKLNSTKQTIPLANIDALRKDNEDR
jgi:hypothetical protein